MSMTICGKTPKNAAGESFHINVWGWRPIHALLAIANEKGPEIFTEDTLNGMTYNDGYGLDQQEDCDKLAEAIAKLLDNVPLIVQSGLGVTNGEVFIRLTEDTRDMAVDQTGRFVGKDTTVPLDELQSPWSCSVEQIREFTKFLRNCGGFEVY